MSDRRLAFSALAFVIIAFCPPGAIRADDQTARGDAAQLVDAILSQIEDREGARLWHSVAKLESIGKDAVPALRSKLGKAGEKGRLACAKALLDLDDETSRAEALAVTESLARSAEAKELRVAAVEILGAHDDPDHALPILEGLFDSSTDAVMTIALARTLWEVDRVARARDKLVDLLSSQDVTVKQEAALALAEMDYFEGEVKEVLRTLKRSPTPEGRRAASLDRILRLSRQLDRGLEKGDVVIDGTDAAKLLKIKEERIRELEDKLDRSGRGHGPSAAKSPADVVLEEVILQIQKLYVEEAKTERKKLVLSAIRGMVAGLDDFSSFMDPEDTKSFRRSIAGEYFGIGAHVNKNPSGPLEVLKPIYGGPAYKAGILSGDKILEVDGVRTDEHGMAEVIEKLQGPEGTTVSLRIFRRGWTEPRVFEIERQRVEVPSVRYELLPGKIGYLQLQQFGEKSADEFTRAIDQLEKEGMAGLILDLRNNPGGLLEAAINIVDQFVAGELPIVTQKGRNRGGSDRPDESPTYPEPFARPSYPMVVLVNQRSASASEIVSGALQDYGRATLIGKRTFGKGSVQRLIPLSSDAKKVLGGEAQLRLTVQYYFLPLGRCIHTIRDENGIVKEEGGVKPDIEVAEEPFPAWRAEEKERIRSQPALLEYVDKSWAEIQKLFVDGDGHDSGRYPGFDDLFKALETTALKEDVRNLIRFHVRRRLEDERAQDFACDLQEDVQLQRGILEVLKKLGEKPESYPRYASLAHEPKAEAPPAGESK